MSKLCKRCKEDTTFDEPPDGLCYMCWYVNHNTPYIAYKERETGYASLKGVAVGKKYQNGVGNVDHSLRPLRDEFAMTAFKVLVQASVNLTVEDFGYASVASVSYKYADAMLKERNKNYVEEE